MELYELEVDYLRPGLEGHRDAIAGGNGRVRGFAKDLTGTTGRNERPRRRHVMRAAVEPDEGRSGTHPVAHTQRHRLRVLVHLHARVRRDALPEHPTDLPTSRIACMKHPTHAVRRLPAERNLSRLVAIEFRAPFDELAHVPRPVVHQHVHRLHPTEVVPCHHRVAGVELRRILVAHCSRNAALRVACIALARIGLGQDDDAAGLRQGERGAQTGDAAADHEEVAAPGHGAILSMHHAQCSMHLHHASPCPGAISIVIRAPRTTPRASRIER